MALKICFSGGTVTINGLSWACPVDGFMPSVVAVANAYTAFVVTCRGSGDGGYLYCFRPDGPLLDIAEISLPIPPQDILPLRLGQDWAVLVVATLSSAPGFGPGVYLVNGETSREHPPRCIFDLTEQIKQDRMNEPDRPTLTRRLIADAEAHAVRIGLVCPFGLPTEPDKRVPLLKPNGNGIDWEMAARTERVYAQ